MVRAAGITAATLFIAIGLAAGFGGANVFGTPTYSQPVNQAPLPKPSPAAQASPSALPSPSPSPVAVDLAVTAQGTIYTAQSFENSGSGGGPHKKHKG